VPNDLSKLSERFLEKHFDQKSLQEGVKLASGLIDQEVKKLGDSKKVLLGGFTRGVTTALTAWLQGSH
jgi:hypothetical protein